MNKDDPLFDPSFKWSLLYPKHWGSWLGVGVLGLFAFVPIKWRDGWAAWLSAKLYKSKLIRKRKNIALTNMRLCFPEKSEQQLDELMAKNFRVVCQLLLALGEQNFRSRKFLEQRVNLIGEAHITPLLEAGENLIMMTPHTYGVDYGGLIWTARGYPLCNMYNNTDNPVFEWFFARQRTQYTQDKKKLFHRSVGLKPMMKAIRKGYIAYYLPDEDFGRQVSVFAPFFATQKATLPVLGKMAKIGKAKVIPIYTAYNDVTQQFDIYIHPSLRDFPTGDDQKDAEIMNGEIEALIQHAPEQFMWTLKFFKTRPEGDIDIYKDC